MPERSSTAVWEGDIQNGNGTMTIGNDVWTGPFSFKSRFEDGKGTNPEELIAAAHAGCYSMALSGASPRPTRRPSASKPRPRSICAKKKPASASPRFT